MMSLLSLEHIFAENKLWALPFWKHSDLQLFFLYLPQTFAQRCMWISYIFTFRIHNSHIKVSIKSITPAGDWLYLGVFEPRLVIACAPGPGGRGGGWRGRTTHPHIATTTTRSICFWTQSSAGERPGRSRSGVSSEPFVFSFTSPAFSHFIHSPPTFWGRCSRRRSIQFPQIPNDSCERWLGYCKTNDISVVSE